MKKSLVAVGVIVALGVIWTGSSWYVGKQLENRMANMVQQANSELTKTVPEAGIIISYENYQRGTFSSQMQLVFKNSNDAQNPVLPAGESIIINQKIDHGPLPGLTHFSFIPALASIHSELAKNSITQPLFNITKDKSLVNATTQIAFDGSTSSVIKLIPVDHTQEDTHFIFGGSTLDLDMDAKANKIFAAFAADKGSVNTKNESGEPVQLSYNGINFTSDSQLSLADLRVGVQKLGLKNLVLTISGKEITALNDLIISASTEVQPDKKNITLKADYSIAAVKAQGHDFGSANLNVTLNNIDAHALSNISEIYSQTSQQLLSDPTVMEDPDLYREGMVNALASSLPLLLKGDPTLSIAPLSWKNVKGESTFNLKLALKNPTEAATPQESPEDILGNYVSSLDTRLVIPMDMAIHLMSQVAQIEGATPEDATQQATQQIKGLAAMGQMFHITQVENDSITASLTFENNQAKLNGETVPLSDLLGSLPFGSQSYEEEVEPELHEQTEPADAEVETDIIEEADVAPTAQ